MNVVDIIKPKHEVNVFNCAVFTAWRDAMDNNLTIQFCNACVHASKQGASATVKYSKAEDKDHALVQAVNECLDKFNKLTGAH